MQYNVAPDEEKQAPDSLRNIHTDVHIGICDMCTQTENLPTRKEITEMHAKQYSSIIFYMYIMT